MATAGFSLLGFLPRDEAINHLRTACVSPNQNEATLEAIWTEARARLGSPIKNAGSPELLDIPAQGAEHFERLRQGWPQIFAEGEPQIKMVEIQPLLAYQINVDGPRSGHHCSDFASPPALPQLLETCLPPQQQEEPFLVHQLDQSLIIKARSLNIQLAARGMIQPGVFGISIGLGLPWVHVVRCNGRCYLHNGYHRAYGAAIAGAAHVPCVFREVPDIAAAGIKADGSTFRADLLESDNPPTMAHFTTGRAQQVTLRETTRILHLSWAEYGIYNE